MIAQPSKNVLWGILAACLILGTLVFGLRKDKPATLPEQNTLKQEGGVVAPAKPEVEKNASSEQKQPTDALSVSAGGLPVPPADAPEMLVLKPESVISISAEGNWDDSLKQFTAAFLKLEEAIATHRLEQTGPYFIVYSDLNDLGFQFKASVPVKSVEGISLPPGVVFDQSPVGEAIRLTHRGPFANIAETYDAIDEYSSKEGLVDANVFIEQYLTQLRGIDDEDLVINVHVMVKKP